MKEVVKEEYAFSKKKQVFDEEHNKVAIQNDQL